MTNEQGQADGPERVEAATELGNQLGLFYRAMRAVAVARMERHGAATIEHSILANAQEPKRAKEIAKTLGLGESAMSRHISHLEQAGLLHRDVDPEDGRAQLVSLTAAGQAHLAEETRNRTAFLLEGISDWDLERIRSTTEAISDLRAITVDLYRRRH